MILLENYIGAVKSKIINFTFVSILNIYQSPNALLARVFDGELLSVFAPQYKFG